MRNLLFSFLLLAPIFAPAQAIYFFNAQGGESSALKKLKGPKDSFLRIPDIRRAMYIKYCSRCIPDTTLIMSRSIRSMHRYDSMDTRTDTVMGIIEFYRFHNGTPDKYVGMGEKITTTISTLYFTTYFYFIGNKMIAIDKNKWFLFVPYSDFQE